MLMDEFQYLIELDQTTLWDFIDTIRELKNSSRYSKFHSLIGFGTYKMKDFVDMVIHFSTYHIYKKTPQTGHRTFNVGEFVAIARPTSTQILTMLDQFKENMGYTHDIKIYKDIVFRAGRYLFL